MGLNVLAGLIGPIMGVVEKVIADKDKQAEIRAVLLEEILKSDSELTRAQSAIISSEAGGDSWLQRSWRPITMLAFLILLFSYWFGFAPDYLQENTDVVDKVFSLLQIGIGGYIGSRGVEKVVDAVARNGGVKVLMSGGK